MDECLESVIIKRDWKRLDGWWTDGWKDGWLNAWMMVGWVDARMDGYWMDGWMMDG